MSAALPGRPIVPWRFVAGALLHRIDPLDLATIALAWYAALPREPGIAGSHSQADHAEPGNSCSAMARWSQLRR